MRSIFLPTVVAAASAALLSSCVVVVHPPADSTMTVANASSYIIRELYIAPTDSAYWGDDLLGYDLLYPGEEITITGLACDLYDMRVVDEFYIACDLYDVELCDADGIWVITDETLFHCPF